MKYYLIIFFSVIIPTSCGNLQADNKYLHYQNIVMLSDMSSRLNNKPQKDTEEIHKIIQFFKNECVKPGEKIGDKSSISFSTFSGKIISSIDIDKIKNLSEKQQFINSTGKYQTNGLTYQLNDFEQKVKYAYKNVRNNGLDLISVLIDKIDNEPIIKQDTYLTDGIDTTFISYDNHIYIFTDGYLEYQDKNANSQFYFGSQEINKVRQYCISNNMDVVKALDNNKLLRLPPNKSDKNQYINLHILETHERDKNDVLQTYKYPRGLRENEILEAVWRKWAKESGFKSFEWKKY
jgi:hypothetical protein